MVLLIATIVNVSIDQTNKIDKIKNDRNNNCISHKEISPFMDVTEYDFLVLYR